MIISVTQFNNFLKGVVDSEPMLGDISVKGEITNYKESYDSLYFCLKDEVCQMDCFAFMKAVGRGFSNGMTVVVDGSVNYLTKFGKISFNARKITPENNLGEQYKKLLELKAKLEKEGLFAAERKKTVPNDCKKIGVVSSENGAVVHDVAAVALRRNPGADIFLYPVKVQGTGAEYEIARGIGYFSAHGCADVVIVARGGGSGEDLSAFNTEAVVRAIAECKIPTVSAVGHDVDFTFADFAADKRAATPTEAAELITADVSSAKNLARSLLNRIYGLAKEKTESETKTLGYRSSALYASASKTLFGIEKELISLSRSLDGNNPAKLLSKGLTKIIGNGKIIKNISELAVGDEIGFALNGGEADAKITGVKVKK